MQVKGSEKKYITSKKRRESYNVWITLISTILHKDQQAITLFRFVLDPDFEPTNNRTESPMKPSVICKKISGGSRSERGAEIYTKRYIPICYASKLKTKNFVAETPSIIKRSVKPG